MTTQEMSGATHSMTAHTVRDAWQPSLSTLAARSMRAVDRLEGRAEQRAAFARHMEQFPPTFAGC